MTVKLLLLYRNTWNHLTMWKKKSSGLLKNDIYNIFINYLHLIYVYKHELALNNQPNLLYLIYMYRDHLALNNPQGLIW